MGRQSKVKNLPRPLREELDRRLVEAGFSGYRSLETWLSERGYQIKKSSLQRYGSAFEKILSRMALATQQAQAVIAASPDSQGAMNDALIRLVQDKVFNTLVDLQFDDVDEGTLAKLARAVADLGRTSVSQKKWAEEMKERLEAQKAHAGEMITKIAREGGLSDDAERAIRKALFAINPLSAGSPGVTA